MGAKTRVASPQTSHWFWFQTNVVWLAYSNAHSKEYNCNWRGTCGEEMCACFCAKVIRQTAKQSSSIQNFYRTLKRSRSHARHGKTFSCTVLCVSACLWWGFFNQTWFIYLIPHLKQNSFSVRGDDIARRSRGDSIASPHQSPYPPSWWYNLSSSGCSGVPILSLVLSVWWTRCLRWCQGATGVSHADPSWLKWLDW